MAKSAKQDSQLPPGPTAKFDLHLSSDSFATIESLINQYGDICRIQPVRRKQYTYLVNNPDYIKHILLTNNSNYKKGIGFERVKMLLGNGLIVSDGDFWRQQRRMIQPSFQKSNIALLSGAMCDSNMSLLKEWELKADSGEVINLTEDMSHLALDIILHAIFSQDVERIVELNGGENPFLFFASDATRDLSVVLKFRALSKLIAEIISIRRHDQIDRQDFLGMFMAARDKDTGESMPDKALIDEVTTMIVAGHETAATTLNWTWYLLSQNPKVEQTLHSEVDQLQLRAPSFEDLAKLEYIRQTLEETLRLYPPVWLFTRAAIDEDRLGPYLVPENADIMITPYFLHRHTKYWDDPEAFLPERFSAAQVKARHRFVHIPFSAGPRRCIGDFFGIVEMQIHLGIMASRFSMEYIGDKPPELEPAVNLRSKHSISMIIKRR